MSKDCDKVLGTSKDAIICELIDVEDAYKILGIPMDADIDAIKKAYRELALKYHPDKSERPDATAKFQEISYAYATLMNKKAPGMPQFKLAIQSEQSVMHPQCGHAFDPDAAVATPQGLQCKSDLDSDIIELLKVAGIVAATVIGVGSAGYLVSKLFSVNDGKGKGKGHQKQNK